MNMNKKGYYHYSQFCLRLREFKAKMHYSERAMAKIFGVSKSEMNRLLIVSRLDSKLLAASKEYEIEKWVLFDFHNLKGCRSTKIRIKKEILAGELLTRNQLRSSVKKGKVNG